MSEWAIGKGDTEERTAFEYREMYLDLGLGFESFYCPFCGVQLTPVNLYKTEEIARSPHFRAFHGNHRFACDGSPMLVNKRKTNPSKSHIDKREFRLPEALVPRGRPTAVSSVNTSSPISPIPDENEVCRRRKEAATRLGPAIYRTSLVRSIAIAYLGVLKESYEQQQKQTWSEEQRQKWVTELLKGSRLTLYDGYTLSYYSAIRTTRFPPPPRPRIFHGWATVHGRAWKGDLSEYVLTPEVRIEHQEVLEFRRFPVEIVIAVTRDALGTGSRQDTFARHIRQTESGSYPQFAGPLVRLRCFATSLQRRLPYDGWEYRPSVFARTKKNSRLTEN